MRHGFLLIDKPSGPTSHDIVQNVRRSLNERSIGHLGTLDPAASGLLVLAVGAKALKLVELFGNATKEYDATIHLGVISTTYDREGILEEVVLKPGVDEPDVSQIQRAIEDRFLGRIQQIPPAFSAAHHQGKRAYEYARAGESISLPPRTIEISKCTILEYSYPILKMRIACSSGTYIRSLAHDLGVVLRTGAYLETLRRTKVGLWSLENAISQEDVLWTNVTPLKEIMIDFPRIDLSDEEAKDISFGRSISRAIHEDCIAWLHGLPVAILTPDPKENGFARPRKVFL